MKRCEGRGAVVTGGGRGIGAACARDLAEAGARVVVTARTVDQVEAVAAELRAAGHEAYAVPCDVTDEGSVRAMAKEATARLSQVDILVNNAGVAGTAPIARTSLEDWQRIQDVNSTGTFLCTRAFLPAMVERGWGRVVNVASVAARQGAAYIAPYVASKHAVLGFTRAVAVEVAKSGVTVNAVCPGYVATDMMEQSLRTISDKTGQPREFGLSHLESLSPQARVFEVGEVSFLVLMLCDERARGINGQGIVLDGGGVQA